MSDNLKESFDSDLRKKAEAQVTLQLKNPHSMSPEEIQTTLHELRVHQIELEMQNEDLQATHAALDISRSQYIDLYDHAPVGYVTLTQQGKITQSNLTFASLIGLPQDELDKQLFSRFILKEDQDIFYRHRRRLFKTGNPQAFKLRMRKQNGTHFWTQLESTVPLGEDRATTCRVVINDISEQKSAEDALRESERKSTIAEALRTRQKLEALGHLAGGIAHDFNNLMSGIFGYIDLAHGVTSEPNVSDFLSKALSTIDRARALTRQLLTFAEGGAPTLKTECLFPFVQETAQFALCGSMVSCCFKTQKDLWQCIIDKNQICQVISNLIINAQQAMPDGGTIEVTSQNISVTETHATLAAGNYVKISVKDQGVGIPKKFLSCIFDPFYSTKGTGRGLGLSTCYSIVKRHGGCIEVESEPGTSSTFHVYLPASLSPAAAPAAIKSTIHFKGTGTFLVMDDEEVVRETTAYILQSVGYSVVLKENGEDAVAWFVEEIKANRTIAGIILDLTIPGGMGGKEAIGEIRKLCPETPVFVTSGYADDPAMSNPKEYGFTDSICKPFRNAKLIEMLYKNITLKQENKTGRINDIFISPDLTNKKS